MESQAFSLDKLQGKHFYYISGKNVINIDVV